jgi:hypothetical protein
MPTEVFTDEIRKINQIIIKEEGARASNGMNKFNLQLRSTAQAQLSSTLIENILWPLTAFHSAHKGRRLVVS